MFIIVPCENGKRYYGEKENILYNISLPEKCQEKCKIDNSCNYWTWTIHDWKSSNACNIHSPFPNTECTVCSMMKTIKWWDVKNAYSISGSKTCIISDIPPKGIDTMLN